jgi:hypothetical protein
MTNGAAKATLIALFHGRCSRHWPMGGGPWPKEIPNTGNRKRKQHLLIMVQI